MAMRFEFTDIPSERIKVVEDVSLVADILKSFSARKIYVLSGFSDVEKFLEMTEIV